MVIEKLKAKSGFGGAYLKIKIPKIEYKKEEHVRGKIHLFGGKVDQPINNLHLRLVREWEWECYAMGADMDFFPGGSNPYSTERVSIQTEFELKGDKGQDEILDIELVKDIEIHAGQKKIFPFDIKLSKVKREKGYQETWKLKARADIPYAKDALVEREIKITFPSKIDKQ